MKKRLLIAAFAMLSVATSFAYNVGEYAYNSTQRFKVIGENVVVNGNFADGRNGWYGVDKETDPSADVWDVLEGSGPNGETVLSSLGATADQPFCNSWQLEPGSYLISFQVKGTTAANLFASSYDASKNTLSIPGSNYVDFFINTTGEFTRIAPTDEAPVTTVSGTTYINDEWKTVNFFCTIEEGQYLVMHLEKIAAGIQFANFEIHSAAEVYDVRNIEKRIAFARELMEMPEFNTDAAQEAKENLIGIIGQVEESIANGSLDDESEALTNLEGLESEGLEPFLAVTSQNLKSNSYFNYVEDLTKFPKYNRKGIKGNTQYGGFMFRQPTVATGGETNWQHGQGGETIDLAIQGTYATNPGSIALYNETLPAGKYFVSAEMRNATMDKNYNLTFDLEREVKAFVGSDTAQAVVIKGEDFLRISYVGDLKQGETFESGFYWDGPTFGSRFSIRNFEIRSFSDVETEAKHKEAWLAFKKQWDAAVGARNKIIAAQSNENFIWVKDSLQKALDKWDPYYNDIIAKGWITADGEDAGIASTDELNDWALYQGIELYNQPEDESEPTRLTYQLVRNYQAAYNYVEATNKPIADLGAAIKDAETTRDDDMNADGDKATYNTEIDKAKALFEDVMKNSNDDKREADVERINAELEALAAAKEVFKASAVRTPMIAIDFSQPFTENEEDGSLLIKGTGGEMNFGSNADKEANTGSNMYGLGCGEELLDILRVGKGAATVSFAEDQLPTDNDVIRVNFDLWVGSLINRYVAIELQNAAGERVAGFNIDRYDGKSEYNDFNNEANTGLDILKYVSSIGSSAAGNVAICVDDNKSSFDLVIDYKANAVRGSVVNGKNGTCNGENVILPKLEDNKIAKFVISTTYDNEGRRCWFDNLKIYKYESLVDGPIFDGVEAVKTIVRDNAIYTLSGVRVEKAAKPGLYIKNGKVIVIK